MNEIGKDHSFFLRFIHELTILRRDASSRGVNLDERLFRFIQIASSFGLSLKSREEFFIILDGYTKEDPQLKKMVEFVSARSGNLLS